jgi:hypothetical protein
LRIPRCAAQDEIRVIQEEMTQAMVMAIHDDPLVLFNDLNEGCEIGFVVSCRGVRVVKLEEFPGCV